ncbi:MAG TPA: TolC family protein [Pyrinomonadaceae bacterium]|nr:TolC family protein [Pyrinomonadaceae bacterium]
MRISLVRRTLAAAATLALSILLLQAAHLNAHAQSLQAARTITLLRGADTSTGSIITITSDAPQMDYASYRSEDRFFVVVRSADVARVEANLNGPGFDDAQLQKREGDAVISFRLKPGTTAKVTQKFNRLEVLFYADGETAASADASAKPAPTPPSTSPVQQPPGTQPNPNLPREAQPTTNPSQPPGAQPQNPQAPPGAVTTTPQTTQPVTPAQTPAQTPTVTPAVPSTSTDSTTTTPGTIQDQSGGVKDPLFPQEQPRPVPPLPSLTRLGVTSDDTLPLSLNDAIRRALEQNNDIEVARQDVRFAETQLRALEGFYEPTLNFNPQITNNVEAQQSTLGGASGSSGTVNRTDIQLNNSVVKFFRTGGGQYEFFFNNLRRTTNSSFNQFNPVYSGALGVQFTQPLWRNRSIDNNRRQIRIQKKRLEQSDADFRRRTIEVISSVQAAYWNLVFALRNQQNQITNLNLARENFRRIEAQIAAGAAAPFSRAEVQTELANRESELLSSVQQVSIAENTLKQLILKDSQNPEWHSQLVPTDNPTFDSTPVNLQDALTEARANRPELKRLNLQQEINQIDIQYFKNQTRPQIDLTGGVSTTGLSGTPTVATSGTVVPLISDNPNANATAFLLDQINQIRATQGLPGVAVPSVEVPSSVPERLVGGYGRTLRNLFSFENRNIVVGVNIQIPFRNKTAEANLAGARIQQTQTEALKRSQEQVVEVEVRNAAQNVETSRQRVLAARAARQSAEVQLEGERRLYQVGRSTTFLLIQRENELANARNLEIRAETDYNKALAELQRATSTTLRANNIIIESPTGP